MKNLRRQARVTAFLRKSLAEGAQAVLTLEAMARTAGLLGERQRITHTRAFKGGKHSLRIRSVRAGFGPTGGWRWEFAIVMECASHFAQSGAFQPIGSRGSPASTIFVHQLTSHRTVGVSS